MKKLITIFVFMFACSFTQKVQAQAFQQGIFLVNAGVTLAQTGQTPIFATAEYGIADNIGIGAKFSYASIGTATTSTFLGGVINWHSAVESNESLEFYSGATVGVPFISGGSTSVTGDVQIIGQAGGRYYFTEQVGGFAELGYAILGTPVAGGSKLAVNVGVSFKF